MKRLRPPFYGLMAEFESPTDIVAAARRTHEAGYRKIDAYSPFAVEGLSEAIGFHKNRVALAVLVGGLAGLVTAYVMQYWINVIDYPLNIAGKPYHSWPAFIIVTFEMTILFAGITAVVGMLLMNGLPMPYHPVFNVPNFRMASRDRFFLCIEAVDPKFDRVETQRFLESLRPKSVTEVPY